MVKEKPLLSDGIFTLCVLLCDFILCMLLNSRFQTEATTPMLFVLGVFLISWRTRGHLWGILASLAGVVAVNFVFTYPYLVLDLMSPASITSAVVMLAVSIITGTLTTELKHQEKLKSEAESERMRGNLLRAVSHDLRTPLTSIYGACCAMIENYDILPKETHLKLLEDVRSDAHWLNRMVENLLSVTRVDTGHVQLSMQSTVLEELIDALLIKFYKYHPKQSIEVQIPEDFISISMDPMLIEQVLMNLLENAVFHAKDMTRLWLRVNCKDSQAIFTVADNGCGISPERMENLFTGMLGSSSPTDTTRSSMGIGLSVCRTIIKAHGSDLTVDSRPGGGTMFSFALEMEENDNVQQ
jgi:two-component system sensor histidine kinase KdpD